MKKIIVIGLEIVIKKTDAKLVMISDFDEIVDIALILSNIPFKMRLPKIIKTTELTIPNTLLNFSVLSNLPTPRIDIVIKR